MNIIPDKDWEVAHKYDGVIYPGYDCPQTLKDDILNSLIEPGQHVKALGAYVESVCIYDERVVVMLIPDDEELNPQLRWELTGQVPEHDQDCDCDVCRLGPDAAKWLHHPSEY